MCYGKFVIVKVCIEGLNYEVMILMGKWKEYCLFIVIGIGVVNGIELVLFLFFVEVW